MPRVGKGLKLLDDSLEALSEVTQLDIDAAKVMWDSHVPAKWKGLLDSQALGPDADISTPYAWDAKSRRYISMSSHRYIPFAELRDQAIEPIVAEAKRSQRILAAQLQSGGLNLVRWQIQMIEQIKQAQIASALAANGGDENNTKTDYKKMAAIILALLWLFRGFSEDIELGRQALNGMLLIRSDLYASASRSAYEEMRRFGMMTYFGATLQEKRELGKAEHCHTDHERVGCVELNDRGWEPINSLPKLGETPCRTNCRCRFVYRYLSDTGTWVVVDDSPTIAVILGQVRARRVR